MVLHDEPAHFGVCGFKSRQANCILGNNMANSTPEADAIQWALNQIGKKKSFTPEEKLYLHELERLKKSYSKDGTAYTRPT